MINQDWHQSAIDRVKQNYEEKNALALWETMRNPANKISRAALQALNPQAPSATATIKDWLAFLSAVFPELPAQLKAREEKYIAERGQRENDWERRQLEAVATGSRTFICNGKSYPHALAFVEGLIADGYTPQKSGIGMVKMVKDHVFIGPMRNKHVNAALKLKGF